MAISLEKNQGVNLTKVFPNLHSIQVCMEWGQNDLDVETFLLENTNKVSCDGDLVYYNNKVHSSGAVIHTGDAQHGGSERVDVNLTMLPSHITTVVITSTIYTKEDKNINFGSSGNAKILVIDAESKETIIDCNLSEDFFTSSSVVICRFEKTENGWIFRRIEESVDGDLAKLCNMFGVKVKHS